MLEEGRRALIQRLGHLGVGARAHPGYGRALKLLNETFRKSSLAQRGAVLAAADWLIRLLEMTSTIS
jgi:hypothetical protein